MIAVDTSAIIAWLLKEPRSDDCLNALQSSSEVLISSATVTETLVVAGSRGFAAEAASMIEQMAFTVVPLTASRAHRAASIYSRWGRGYHPAKLNFGDCFSYAVAEEHGCPLLYIGNDFSQTDVRSALAAQS